MRIAFLSILIAVACLTSCMKEEQVPFPISEEELVKVMADVHFAEAAVKDLTNLEKDSVLTVYYEQIYAIHEIDSSILDSCLVLLGQYPKTSVKLYGKIVERITVLQNDSKKPSEAVKPSEDVKD